MCVSMTLSSVKPRQMGVSVVPGLALGAPVSSSLPGVGLRCDGKRVKVGRAVFSQLLGLHRYVAPPAGDLRYYGA